MERYPFGEESKVKPDALIAYALGVLASYVLQVGLGFGGGAILTTLIVVAVGGLWYHWRRVV